MWPYTGEESSWFDRAEPAVLSPVARSSGGVQPACGLAEIPHPNSHPDKSVVPAKSGRAQPLRLQALDRLCNAPEQRVDQDLLPLIAARLKDPLNAIRASARLLRSNPDLSPEQRGRHLDVVLQENEHLADIISAMLDTSLSGRQKHRS